MGFVNQMVIDTIEKEIEVLRCEMSIVEKAAKDNNLDLRCITAYSQLNSQVARLSKALKPLTERCY